MRLSLHRWILIRSLDPQSLSLLAWSHPHRLSVEIDEKAMVPVPSLYVIRYALKPGQCVRGNYRCVLGDVATGNEIVQLLHEKPSCEFTYCLLKIADEHELSQIFNIPTAPSSSNDFLFFRRIHSRGSWYKSFFK